MLGRALVVQGARGGLVGAQECVIQIVAKANRQMKKSGRGIFAHPSIAYNPGGAILGDRQQEWYLYPKALVETH